ncbi:MAG TPA: ribose-5-phosphate isomerase RpiA [Desulfurococcales archaeon]|nr:ribose-5-phosphate isomerase RpiA [Desulfurococcales archaeon]
MNAISEIRERIALEALKYIGNAKVIGVGTGSTVGKFIEKLGEYRREFGDRLFIASSYDTILKLREYGFKVIHPLMVSEIDVYIDSADEVDKELNLVKGGGAALTLEKILTYYSKKRVFIVDYMKVVNWLGEKHPIPVDVIPYAVTMVYRYLKSRGYNVKVRYTTKGKYGPVISDIGGIILDIKLDSPVNVRDLERELKSIPGVIETGLFIDLVDVLIVGYKDKVVVRKRS